MRLGPICLNASRVDAARFKALGYEAPEVLGDPALLLPLFCRASEQQAYEIGIVPNYIEKEIGKALAAQMGEQELVIVIDPEGEVEDFVRRLTSCKCLVDWHKENNSA